MLLLLAAIILPASCSGRPHQDGTRVSGKIVLEGMAMEGATIEIFIAGDTSHPILTTRSGYHGSFTTRLAPGKYTLLARHELQKERRKLQLQGRTTIVIPEGLRRLDQVVVLLTPRTEGYDR